ncbi:MAG: recombinase zinc beta ribbon domain-containing protein, partial [Faecalibacterium sp.]|nr:recombinase zinc beta ribbon domain-containing protein [Faecalibacterium sp.]
GNMVQGKYGSISYKSKINRPRPKESWYIVEGTHEPIIERELWDKVQAIVALRAKPCYTGKVGIFAKKVRCVNCGYVMRSSKNRGKHYLQCSNRHVAKDACIGSFIGQDKLEQMVIGELKRLSDEYLDRDELEARVDFCNELTAQKEKLRKELAAYERQIEDYAKKIKTAYMDKLNGVITENDFLDLTREFSADKERLTHAATDTQKQIAAIDARLSAGDNRRKIIEQYLDFDHLTRDMVELLIDHITVGKREKGEKDPPVEIHWNF